MPTRVAWTAPGTPSASAARRRAFYELALHPDAEQRVHEEISSVLQGRPVQAEDLPALDYTRRVVKETLRLHPAPWMLGRRTLVPVRLGTAELPAGTELAYCTYAMHRNPAIHPDPLRFDPDRWLPDRAKSLTRCSDLAFGAGVRKCIGDALTMNQVLTAVATIAARWQLRTVPGHRYRPRARIVISPGPLSMTCHPRDCRSDESLAFARSVPPAGTRGSEGPAQ
ncbi:cytochrome P450 [Streptomyces aurantiacus]|uniref:cytochrome P450 n=1 Tax=Streptomyces aurantiacus TaxID=47760 RepID=UPI0027921216|nr:cytochrome P450 [Streptomyces aurantiacus]MDQ0779055.1 cytochrome P450 [Streptomyces aurantiacus]